MKAFNTNGLAILGAKDGQFPKRTISLLEIMRELKASKIYQWDILIEDLLNDVKTQDGATFLLKKANKEVLDTVSSFVEQFHKLGWKEAFSRAVELKCLFDIKFRKANNIKRSTSANLQDALFELKSAINGELNARKFLMIENSKSVFVEQKNLFGKQVQKAFPSARHEITAAGNCLATDLNTAAAFHSVRVAEIGMRELATKLKVVVVREKTEIAIKDATWNELIGGIYRQIESEKCKPKAERLVLKSHFREHKILADHLDMLKDDRNRVMHTQGDYGAAEALGVFERVRDFMKKLSMQVSEKNE